MMERSLAIKCPSIQVISQLFWLKIRKQCSNINIIVSLSVSLGRNKKGATGVSKARYIHLEKMVLSIRPTCTFSGVLEKFLDSSLKVQSVRKTFTGLYSLDKVK